YTNPYHTRNGVSRGLKAYYRTTDAAAANIAEYTTDIYGGSVSYGIPLTEYNRASASLGYEDTRINPTANTPANFLEYLDANSSRFDLYTFASSWSHDTRNRAIFADQGTFLSLSLDSSLPGSGIEYYKIGIRGLRFTPVNESLTLLTKSELGYGGSYGDTTELPFFEHYFAGGTQTVR
ncbi:MAG: BamA/TamA family outer membrane protein, partial [Gammaproteobacteria bacterium]|nr:BamA/TamA family outer membrane protein [Gammaproteobacteria bacterium]NIR92336.1 BamA/TamA family outer membrane protein [Gammaproteobacteria bacterium]NIW46770.1 BamA/TamA family outer membrane protein [Gammaproteobacteria bacterium]NIX57785.1 BamA/TamA family outer membrane protein [candidate division Zixibacteria bacterium]